MFRYVSAAIIGILISGSAYGTGVQDLSALRGCWQGAVQGGILQESWSAMSAGMMFGTDQLLDSTGAKSLGWGSMTITPGNSGIQFGYSDGGTAQQVFDLAKITGSNGDLSVTFANTSTSDVNAVVLTLTGNQSLRIQLFGQGGSAGYDFLLNRISQTAECP
jgi:hypothetical protein